MAARSTIVYDIEVAGFPWEEVDEITDDELRQERVRLQALTACRAEVIQKKGKDGPSRFSATQAEERNEDARRRIAWIDSVLAYREELKRQEKTGSKNPPVQAIDSSTRRKTG